MKPIMAEDFRLEQPSIEHIQSCFEAAMESVTDIYPWMEWCHPKITEAEIAKLIEEDIHAWQTGDYYAFMIVDSSSSEVIGQVVVNHINRTHNFANLGYWIRSSRTGLGIASRASLLVAKHCFEAIGLHRLEIIVPNGNVASRKVAQKCGAQEEGKPRQRVHSHGEYLDAIMYSLIQSDLVRSEAT